MGGGFGGKDEITIQIHLALLTLKTGRPVKIVLSREESIVVGWKRHPMVIKLKTAATKEGELLANEVTLYSDTGAYASLGGSVLNVAIENSSGAYRVPNVRKIGYCVYTNNGVAGAMRGFGDNQVTFAMETQMDLLARQLGLDPLEIRLKNGLRQGDTAPLGHTMTQSVGTIKTLEFASQWEGWLQREKWKAGTEKPWLKRGIGVATGLKGVGLGRGLTDISRATITLHIDGTFTVAVGCPDIGQGNNVAYSQIAAEALECDINEVTTINGDTLLTPDAGSSTASRSIYAAGNAIINAAGTMLDLLKQEAAKKLNLNIEQLTCQLGRVTSRENSRLGCSYSELAGELIGQGINCVAGSFVVPVPEREIQGAAGLPHLVYSGISNVAMVEVNMHTGECQVIKVLSVPDAGRVINMQGIEGQADGGVLMGMGYALCEDVLMEGGRVLTPNLSTYIMHTALDAPESETHPVEELESSGPYGAKGVGEAILIAVTPAITNAILDATGVAVSLCR
nr:molybdopterin cofactor-binding domain-containing protein [Desulforamulus aquiferis]